MYMYIQARYRGDQWKKLAIRVTGLFAHNTRVHYGAPSDAETLNRTAFTATDFHEISH